MADKTQSETVILKLDQQISGPADVATGALGRLDAKIGREIAALGRFEQSLKLAKAQLGNLARGDANGVVDIAAYKKQAGAVQSLTDRIANQRDKIATMKEKLVAGKSATQQLGEASKFLGKELGVTGGQAGQLAAQLGSLGVYGAIAAVAILATVGAVAALVTVVAKGISAAGEMRDELIQLRAASVYSSLGMNWLYNGTRASTAAAEQMQAAITRVLPGFGGLRTKLAEYAVQVRQARFQGKDFETVLKAMSTAATGGTEAMAQGFLAAARDARFFGRSIDGLAERVEKKLGENARAKVLSLGIQIQKFGENVKYIFSGADIDPFLRGLQAVLGMFDADSKSAKDMRVFVTQLVEKAIGLFLRFEIVLLTAYIWLRKHDAVWKALGYTVLAIGASIGLVTLAIGALVVALGVVVALAAVWAAVMVAAVALPAVAIGWLVLKFVSGWQAIKDTAGAAWAAVLGGAADMVADLIGLGGAIINGIVSGMKAAGSAVWGALKGIIMGAIKNVKALLGIASPSRIMADQVGRPMAEGTAQGVEKAAPEVADAAGAMAEGGAKAASGAAQGGASPATGGGPTFQFYSCDFGAANEDTIRAMLHRAFEAESMGAALPGAA